MYGCESWTMKKSECQGTDGIQLWSWRRLSRVHWTARKSNWSILKETSPEYTLEGLMLKLKFQYFGHLVWRADLLEKTLMLGKTKARKRRGQQRSRWLDGITNSIDMSLSKLLEMVKDWEAWSIEAHGVTKSWTQLSNWTMPNMHIKYSKTMINLAHNYYVIEELDKTNILLESKRKGRNKCSERINKLFKVRYLVELRILHRAV